MKINIYPSITTCNNADWRSQIKEVKSLGLKEVCVFPTVLGLEARQEMYNLLEKTSVEKIPLLHHRSDIDIKEMDYLIKRFKVEAFNIHSTHRHRPLYDISKYKNKIFVENQYEKFKPGFLDNYAGVCLDAAHLENTRLAKSDLYKHFLEILEKNKIGCCHISAITKEPWGYKDYIGDRYDAHEFNDLSEFNYLIRYKKYLPKICAIEVRNPIKEQLKVINYLKAMLFI